jgi:tRNA pseudouridine55 synthase
LLVIAVGPAARLLQYVQELPKTYEATAQLGVRTTTLDAAGEEVSRTDVDVNPQALREAAAGLVGTIEQVPPAVSAVKVGGERAYRKARRGEPVELPPRTVTVYTFDIPRSSADAFDARIVCSSGTYVRSLVAEVGERLGCGAHVVHLRRIAIGHLSVADAVPLDALEKAELVSPEAALSHLPRVDVDAALAEQARNGRPIPSDATGERVLVRGPDGAVGIFTAVDGQLKPVTVLGR